MWELIQELEFQFDSSLADRAMSTVDSSPKSAANSLDTISDAELSASLPALRRIAEELFSDSVELAVEHDPELDDEWYVVFSVKLKADPAQALPLRLAWYERTWALLGPRCRLIRLSIETSS